MASYGGEINQSEKDRTEHEDKILKLQEDWFKKYPIKERK